MNVNKAKEYLLRWKNNPILPKEFSEAIEVAIDALEKQIPKKPIYRWTGDETVIECPCCEHYQFDLSECEWARKFCGNCGQAILWDD